MKSRLLGAVCAFLFSLITVSANAALLVGDSGNKAGGINDVIMEFDGSTGIFSGFFASGGGLDVPTDMTYGPDGNLYVASLGSDNILRYDGTTGAFINVASGGGIEAPFGVTFGPDGNLYVSNLAGIFADSVLRYNGTTGAFIDVFSSGLNGPRNLRFGPDGNLYVANSNAGNILRFDGGTGAFIDIFASSGLNTPWGLTFGPDDNLYVSSELGNRVIRYDGINGDTLGIFASFGLDQPRGLVFGPDDNLYVASVSSDIVTRYDGNTGNFIDLFASGSNLSSSGALAFTPAAVPIPPAIVTIDIEPDGTEQECSEQGGASVQLTAEVNEGLIASVTWMIDGIPAGDTETITPFLELGQHSVQVDVVTDNGSTGSATETITVADTIPPQIEAAFVDPDSGQTITQIPPNNREMSPEIHVTDVCDSEPAVDASVGIPSESGDTFRVKQVKKSTSIASDTNPDHIELSVSATDASGNSATENIELEIVK